MSFKKSNKIKISSENYLRKSNVETLDDETMNDIKKPKISFTKWKDYKAHGKKIMYSIFIMNLMNFLRNEMHKSPSFIGISISMGRKFSLDASVFFVYYLLFSEIVVYSLTRWNFYGGEKIGPTSFYALVEGNMSSEVEYKTSWSGCVP